MVQLSLFASMFSLLNIICCSYEFSLKAFNKGRVNYCIKVFVLIKKKKKTTGTRKQGLIYLFTYIENSNDQHILFCFPFKQFDS